ncbi:hypothetical protein ABK040_012516 [Willaertia magna]
MLVWCHFKANLQWYLTIYPKGNDQLKEGEGAIYLHLKETKTIEKKEISSITIRYLFSNINLEETSISHNENAFDGDDDYGYGFAYTQKDYSPTIVNDRQIFKILIAMKKL